MGTSNLKIIKLIKCVLANSSHNHTEADTFDKTAGVRQAWGPKAKTISVCQALGPDT